MSRARATLLAALAALLIPWLVGSCSLHSESSQAKAANTTAAQLAATMNAALRSADSMTGRGVVRLTTALGTQAYAFSFAADSQGDYRLETEWRRIATGAGGTGASVTQYRRSLAIYNAGEHKLVTRSWEPARVRPSSGTLESQPPASTSPSSGSTSLPAESWSVQTDVPGFAAVPDGIQDLQGLGPLAPEFASTARAALAAQGNAAIAGSESGGRAVWSTTVPLQWPAPPTGRVLTRVRLVVDQATGLTTRMTLVFADGWRAQIEYSDLMSGAKLSPDAFDSSVPSGIEPSSSASFGAAAPEGFFRFASLDQARAMAGVPVLLPTFALSGFSLSEVVTAETGRRGPMGRPAPELWLVYRDGLESYWLRLQKAPFGMAPAWGSFAGASTRDLDHGPFAGQPAHMWVRGVRQGTYDFAGPGLFVENEEEVARLAGDLLPYEYWQVANSLKPHSP